MIFDTLHQITVFLHIEYGRWPKNCAIHDQLSSIRPFNIIVKIQAAILKIIWRDKLTKKPTIHDQLCLYLPLVYTKFYSQTKIFIPITSACPSVPKHSKQTTGRNFEDNFIKFDMFEPSITHTEIVYDRFNISPSLLIKCLLGIRFYWILFKLNAYKFLDILFLLVPIQISFE